MIQTVTEAIGKDSLGAVLMHEHISCASLSYEKAFGRGWIDRKRLKALSVEALKLLKEKHRLGLMVDGTPIDLGRNALLLKEIAELSGVKIVASTGFYYLPSIETLYNDADALAKCLIDECRTGIENTGIKPGILKCATGEAGITADNQKKLSTMGIVQGETGLPLYVHCEHRDGIAQKQIEILCENGANIEKIIIGHTALRYDAAYLEKILDTGCYICMDQCFCYPHKLTEIAASLVYLCHKGYTNKILLSNDRCIHSDFCRRDKSGLELDSKQHAERLGHVFDHLHPAYLSVGGSEKDWNTMICKNSIEALDA